MMRAKEPLSPIVSSVHSVFVRPANPAEYTAGVEKYSLLSFLHFGVVCLAAFFKPFKNGHSPSFRISCVELLCVCVFVLVGDSVWPKSFCNFSPLAMQTLKNG